MGKHVTLPIPLTNDENYDKNTDYKYNDNDDDVEGGGGVYFGCVLVMLVVTTTWCYFCINNIIIFIKFESENIYFTL